MGLPESDSSSFTIEELMSRIDILFAGVASESYDFVVNEALEWAWETRPYVALSALITYEGMASADETETWLESVIYPSQGRGVGILDSYRQGQRSKEYWDEVFELNSIIQKNVFGKETKYDVVEWNA